MVKRQKIRGLLATIKPVNEANIREWLKGRVNEISDVKGVFGELVFSQLALVEVIDKQTNGTVERIRTTRETFGRTC